MGRTFGSSRRKAKGSNSAGPLVFSMAGGPVKAGGQHLTFVLTLAGGAAPAKRMLSTTTSNRRKWASPRRHSPFVRFRPGKVQSQSTHRRRLGLGVSLEKRGLFFVTRLIRRRRLPPFIKGCSFVRSSPCRLVVIECPELWRHRRDALPRATGQPSPSGPGGEIFHCNERGRTDRAGER